MAAFTRIEEIIAWQKARGITTKIYRITSRGGFEKHFELKKQIRRAAVSIMANIAEGFGRNSDKEFANLLNISHGSAYEVISHLYVALDLGYLDNTDFDALHRDVTENARVIYGLRMSLIQKH